MTLYCPGAVLSPQPGGVTLDTTLPARAVWHITWDQLDANGKQPAFSAVSNYLKNQGYCPHIMWNPFTGYIEQFYPTNVGGRALNAWNQDGVKNIQIEVFFTPGCVVNGKKYETVADTPLVGFDKIMDWLDANGIPRVWPMGAPKWQGNSRDANIWNTKAGHYGHCNVPDNTHTDPGPMPDLGRKDDDVANVWDDDIQEYKADGRTPASKKKAGFILGNLNQWVTRILKGQADINKKLDLILSKLPK